MHSRWDDSEAQAFVTRYRSAGQDLALRVYSSRLIGAEPDLVLHGGGNTSVKTVARDLTGNEIEVLCVKGSGWDLASIEPEGLPAVELDGLRRLRALPSMTDEQMVNEVRRGLLDVKAPTPSVETLLHAFLPHKFVDHSHADAILVLTNQPDGEALVREALGDSVVVLPWIMPGFPLAKAVADAYEAQPSCQGIVLLHHGLFTFGEDARQSYERMIELVDRAERFVAGRVGPVPPMLAAVAADAGERRRLAAEVLPILRGRVALQVSTALGQKWQRQVADWRDAEDLVAFSTRPEASDLAKAGPLTPDHVLRTKPRYLYLTRRQAEDGDACRQAVQEFLAWYAGYYQEHRQRLGVEAMRSPVPAVAVVEGCGLIGFGTDRKGAAIAADIAEHTLRAQARGQALGRYVGLAEAELFEMEYWSLELAKLGTSTLPELGGQVALVTGAGGAVGHGIADALLAAGAHVFVTDIDAERLDRVAERLREDHPPWRLATGVCDIASEQGVAGLFEACCLAFGGADIVVPNAGIAYVAPLAEMDAERFRQVVEVNLTGTMLVLREAARVFAAQGTAGTVVIQASKNAFAPGASFGAYSASKAGALQLGKVAALELAELGVRVNMINADAVFGDERVPSGLWQAVGPARMRARGLDPGQMADYYRQRSLLKVPVLARHVGEAVVFFAAGRTPTTGATLPVDGGIPEAFPR